MAAVVRVKRLIENEPLDALLINCKKRKTEASASVDLPLSAVLKFAGTVDDQSADILKHIKNPTKPEIEDVYKKHKVNIANKLRQETQIASKESRYKVINCFRASGCSSPLNTETPEKTDTYTIYDVELKEASAGGKEGITEQSNYVYDLYYTQSDDFGDAEMNELISVYPLSSELVYGSYRDNGINDTDSYDSEDSNAESNWRNDYPDEESDLESITEDDMVKAVNRMNIDNESDLSSDEDEEKYVYDDDHEDDDIDEEDARKYGRSYARFKAKSQKLVETKNHDHNFYIGDEDDYYD